MFAPLYGSSVAPPVSSAPDLPSHRTSDYRDPINDVNGSYKRLQESLTVDNQTLLGQVKATTAAPSEIVQANYSPDQNDIDRRMAEAFENAQYCDPFSNTNYHQGCVNKAPSSNFPQQVTADLTLQGIEALIPLYEGIAYGALGATALTLCAVSVPRGGTLAAWTPEGAAFFPAIYSALAARGLMIAAQGVARSAPPWRAPALTIDDAQSAERWESMRRTLDSIRRIRLLGASYANASLVFIPTPTRFDRGRGTPSQAGVTNISSSGKGITSW